jgi:PAS domain S-box-containing protein
MVASKKRNTHHMKMAQDKDDGILQGDATGNGSLISILYVDDEEMILELAKAYLERSGEFTVDTANSAHAAIEKLDVSTYDGIISDYQMPGLTGIDLLKYIRQQDDQTPFLLFTGRGKEEVAIEALNCGADYYLKKDVYFKVQFAQLEHVIRKAVFRRHEEREQKRVESILQWKAAAIRFVSSPIAISDSEGRVLYANPACLALLGYTEEQEVLGRPLHEFFDGSPGAPRMLDVLSRDGQWSGKVVVRAREGSALKAEVSARNILDESGNPDGFVVLFTVLTGQKRAK